MTAVSDDGCGTVPSDTTPTGAGVVSEDGGNGKSDGDSMGDAAAGPAAPCLWLEALAGCLKGQVWEVGPKGGTLGRASDNSVSLADKEMSRRHSKVWWWWLSWEAMAIRPEHVTTCTLACLTEGHAESTKVGCRSSFNKRKHPAKETLCSSCSCPRHGSQGVEEIYARHQMFRSSSVRLHDEPFQAFKKERDGTHRRGGVMVCVGLARCYIYIV